MNNIIIRKETEADYKATELMVMRAFWNIHSPGCTEHLLVRILRNSKDFLPEFSRVAELDGRIVGAIFYSKAKVVDGETEHEIVTFGPLAVEPTLQDAGIGRLLMEETFKLAKTAGYPGICIYGEAGYYPKVGFKHCKPFGITDPEGNTWDALMVYPLDEAAFSHIHGKLFESSDFEACEDEAAIREIEKELPAYPKKKLQDGFYIINDNRIGTILSVQGSSCRLAFWELEIEADIPESIEKLPEPGDTVLFKWNKKESSVITKNYGRL